MEGSSSSRTEGETIPRLLHVDLSNLSLVSSAADTSLEVTPVKKIGKGNMAAVDLDAIESFDESNVENQTMLNIIPERREPKLNVAAIHKGVIIVEVIFGFVATIVLAVALQLPQWVCNTEMLRNGTSNACCGPWRICGVLLTLDNEVAFDNFEVIGSLGIAKITLLFVFSLVALIEAAPPTRVCLNMPWAHLIKVKMIICCCISIIYVTSISLFNKMIADLSHVGFKASYCIDIMYSGFVSSILLYAILLVEYCTLTLRKDPPPILSI